MISVKIKEILALKPVSDMMAYDEAHIESEHRPAIASRIVTDLAKAGGTIGENYETLESLEYFLRVRAETIKLAMDELKDLGFDMSRGLKLDPNKMHLK